MSSIRTVLGDIPAGQLGPALTHEHVIAGWLGFQWDPRCPSLEEMIAEAVRQLVELRERTGLTGLIDATTPDLGRDLAALAEVSERAEVHIVASAGLYRYTVAYPEYWRLADEERLFEWLVDELERGSKNGGVRCGALKVATVGVELHELERKLLRAAGRAAVATGRAVLTHTEPDAWRAGNPGLAQLRALGEVGVPPGRVVVGHACSSSNLGDLIAVLETGATLGIDRIGADFFQPDPVRALTLAALVRAGYRDRLVLAHDHQAVWRTPTTRRVTSGTYLHLADAFEPRLRALGVTDDDLRAMLVANPARLFASGGAGPDRAD